MRIRWWRRTKCPIAGVVLDLMGPLEDIHRIIELGNKKTGEVSYKSWFESLGKDHVSIDLNGRDGALPLDLTKPIELPPADMVTNIGTSEHVLDQRSVFRNIHRLCKPGGIMVHVVPVPGGWPGHGRYYPTPEFFEELSRRNDYEIERLFVKWRHKGELVWARLRRRGECESDVPLELISDQGDGKTGNYAP